MILEKGKYYKEDEVVYECIKTSDGSQEGKLSALTEYVKKYEGSVEPEPEPSEEGTITNPIKFSTGMIIHNGKYYIEDGIIYQCFRDSGIAIHNNLKDLVNIYVKTATV